MVNLLVEWQHFLIFLSEVIEGRNNFATVSCSAILGTLFISNKSDDIRIMYAKRYSWRKTDKDFQHNQYFNHYFAYIFLYWSILCHQIL